MIDVSLQLTVNTVNVVDLEVHVCTQFKKLILFIFCWTRDTCSSYIHTYIHTYIHIARWILLQTPDWKKPMCTWYPGSFVLHSVIKACE